MCEACAAESASLPARRRKLWEIPVHYHCPIIGTCLALGDLRKIAAKVSPAKAREIGDYELHVSFVHAARGGTAQHKSVARLVHKVLERRYRRAVAEAAAHGDAEDLLAYWDRAVAEGDIPGPMWAVMTHPAATPPVLDRVYGDVHMLSHLVGAANRADIRRLQQLEQANLDAERRHTEERERLRQRLARKDAEIEDLRGDLARAQRVRRQSGQTAFERRGLEVIIEGLRQEIEATTRRAVAAEARLAERERESGRLRQRLARLARRLEDREAEIAALEQELAARVAADPVDDGAPDTGDLAGRQILYVGGRPNLVPTLRTLVERRQGAFLYHDGGQAESEGRLADLLGRADVVVCPIDCVSHGACQKAKKHCKTCAKRFIALRSSGLSAFARGLQEVAGSGAGADSSP